MAVPTVRNQTRLSRPERRERTRGDLLAAARTVFERYGFHRVGSYTFMVGEQPDEDIIMRACV